MRRSQDDELLTIRGRMLASYAVPPDLPNVQSLRDSLTADGTWPDVDYVGSNELYFHVSRHLDHLTTLVRAWFAFDSPLCGNAGLRSHIDRALDYWLHTDPMAQIWYHNQITTPLKMSVILLMLDVDLTDFQRAKGSEILARVNIPTARGHNIDNHGGHNLVCCVDIAARHGVLRRDADLLRYAFNRIAADLCIGEVEGIQADYSFFQHGHGPTVYNHGYGANYVENLARLAATAAGTEFALPPEKMAILSALILDGSQWMARGPHVDFGPAGRNIAQSTANDARYLGRAAAHMLAVPTGREGEFLALVDRIAAETTEPLIGNRHFWRSDFMVHHRPAWYASARMYSVRTWNTDAPQASKAGLLSHFIADGATCIMTHGNEYEGIYPVWDWQRIPGTTVELAPHMPGSPVRHGTTAFVGGVSDGTAGVAAFQIERKSLRASKAWFFFSDAVMCLGAGIRCDSDFPVVTTVNQCRVHGPVVVGHDDGADTLSEATESRPYRVRWIWHDGIAYLFNALMPVSVFFGRRTGNWRRICAMRSEDPVTDRVFQLELSHGVRPGNASYAYAAIPGIRASDVQAIASCPRFQIVTNSPDIQAVHHAEDDMLSMVFHMATSFEWGDWRVAVDRACVLILRRNEGRWLLALADPAAGCGVVRVDIAVPGREAISKAIRLPEGLRAGASTIVELGY